jgi:hypothetical protein
MRLVALLVVVVLVNLPLAHDTWTDHEISSRGREVTATVTETHTLRGSRLVEYKLPKSVDPAGTTYTAQVDEAAFEAAMQGGALAVRVVPGNPSSNRPDAEVPSHLFLIVAAIADLILLAILLLSLTRGRRWRHQTVVAVDGDLVTFTMDDLTLTGQVPASAAAGYAVGDVIRGALHLTAAGDVFPGSSVGVLERRDGARYLVRGRVVAVDRDHVKLQLDNGFVLPVRVGSFKNRADLRDHGELTGTLVLVPLRPARGGGTGRRAG